MEFATSIAVYWATTVLGKEPYSRCLVAVAPNGIKGRMTSLVLTYDLRLMILVCYPSLMVNITLNMLFFFFFLMTYGYWKQQHHPSWMPAKHHRRNMAKQRLAALLVSSPREIFRRWTGWVWLNTYKTIIKGITIHLPAILMFTNAGFWPKTLFRLVSQQSSASVIWRTVATGLALQRPWGHGGPGLRESYSHWPLKQAKHEA